MTSKIEIAKRIDHDAEGHHCKRCCKGCKDTSFPHCKHDKFNWDLLKCDNCKLCAYKIWGKTCPQGRPCKICNCVLNGGMNGCNCVSSIIKENENEHMFNKLQEAASQVGEEY